jgi:hypothetical protein
MFLLYLLAEDTREFEILTRPERTGLTCMYSKESAWLMSGALSPEG